MRSIRSFYYSIASVIDNNYYIQNFMANRKIDLNISETLWFPVNFSNITVRWENENNYIEYRFSGNKLTISTNFSGSLLDLYKITLSLYEEIYDKIRLEEGYLFRKGEIQDVLISVPHYFPLIHDRMLSELVKKIWESGKYSIIVSTVPRILIDYNEWQFTELEKIISKTPYYKKIEEEDPVLLIDLHSFEGNFIEVGTLHGTTLDFRLIKYLKKYKALPVYHERTWRIGGNIIRYFKNDTRECLQLEIGRKILRENLDKVLNFIDNFIKYSSEILKEKYYYIITYGTLSNKENVLRIVGRECQYKNVVLFDSEIIPTDLGYPTIIYRRNNKVLCKAFRINKKEMEKIKDYEKDYKEFFVNIENSLIDGFVFSIYNLPYLSAKLAD